jgi:glutathione S-transferase
LIRRSKLAGGTMTIKLYAWPQSSGTRIAWALEELATPYEYVQLDGSKQEHRAASYLAINPHGKVPALVDGEVKLFESGAILIYLGEKYGVAKELWPRGGGQPHADALCWTVWSMVELGQNMMQYAYHGLDSPFSYEAKDRSKAAADYSLSQFNRNVDALEARLEGREHVLGSFTLVDIAASSLLMFGAYLGVKFDAYPRVGAWFARCRTRPALARAR